jgi:ArsR family transcriptional regulator
MDDTQFHRIAKALADRTRFEILERIAQAGEEACAKLNEQLKISPATISHHVKELSTAGLLEARREAKFSYYRVRRETWRAYLQELKRRIPKPPKES